MNRLRPTLLAWIVAAFGCAPSGDDDAAGRSAPVGGQGGDTIDAQGSPPSGGAPGSVGGASGSGGARAEGEAAGGADAAVLDGPRLESDSAIADAAGETGPPASTGLMKIFDGTGWDNWEYDPKAWTIQDGAMHGTVTSGQSQAFTKKDYSSFRLIVWSRMPKGNDHLGICFWGSRPAAGRYGFGGCLLVIPPNAAIWDYSDNTDHPKPDYQKGQTEWHRTEILANRETGRVLVTVGGRLIHDYQDPPTKLPRRKNGPIGMQIHKAGTESEYKDIEIEVDPKSDKLITVAP